MIYLDHNATTPISPAVYEAMTPYLTTEWGNPSSSYGFGAKLRKAVERAREQTALLIGAQPDEIAFTSCATESNNWAIRTALQARPGCRHLVTSAVEHSSVLNCCQFLERTGFAVTYLRVDRDGLLSIADLEAAITDETALVSLMWANNETGVFFPVDEIASVCAGRGVPFHCDAVQAAGKLQINVASFPVDFLSLSGHKLCAPKGVGALFIRRGVQITPLLHGGHQEHGRRGGTENVAFIVGLGTAAEHATSRATTYVSDVSPIRDAFEGRLTDLVKDATVNGHCSRRLANTTNITFPGVNADALLMLLDEAGVCASTGSACLADSTDSSHVIQAMKPESEGLRENVRFSFDATTTQSECIAAANIAAACVAALRA